MSDIIYVSNIGPHMSNIAMPALHSMSNTSQNREISRYLAAAVLVLVPVPLKITKWYWYRYRYRSKFQNWYWYRPGTDQKFGTVIHCYVTWDRFQSLAKIIFIGLFNSKWPEMDSRLKTYLPKPIKKRE